jgi:hypothetical protein
VTNGSRRRRQNFDALGDDDGLAVDVAVLAQHFAGVETDAHGHALVEPAATQAPHLHLDLAARRHGAPGRRERGHQPVTHLLDEHAALVGHDLAGHRFDLTADLTGGVVAEGLVQPRGLDQVGEQDRDGALGNLLVTHREPLRSLNTDEP